MDTLLSPSEVTDSMHKSGEQLLQIVSASEKQNRAGESQEPTGQGREKAGISTPCALSQFHPCKSEKQNWKTEALAVPSSFGHLTCMVWQDYTGKRFSTVQRSFSQNLTNSLPHYNNT